MTATYLAVKFYNSSTWEFFCSFLFLYGKFACIMMFLMSSVKGAVYYVTLCFFLWLTLSHPRYSVASKLEKVRSMNELAEKLGLSSDKEVLEIAKVKRNTKAKKDYASVKTTVLVFTAGWADQCYFTHPLWVRFANRFTTSRVKFIECDAARFEKLCYSFKISTSNMANQLPTLMLLEDNVEFLRFPPIDIATG